MTEKHESSVASRIPTNSWDAVSASNTPEVHPEAGSESDTSEAPWKKWETVFTNAKAGMAGVDKEKVQKVVFEMSEGSTHFKNEERKQEQLKAKIATFKKRAAALSSTELRWHTKSMDADMAALNASRDLTRTWIVVDMDAFYASVEERDSPALKTKPMAVGGIGMICTANYVARKFGVRSAMPGFIALKLCPELVFVKPNFTKYKAASDAVKSILKDYDPDASSYSLDEAFLDVTDYCAAHHVSGGEVAAEIRRRVRETTTLTCSCGVAPNTMLAKICADFNKPDGQCVLPPTLDTISTFMAELPIRKVPGIGKVQQQTLNALDIETCADLLQKRGLLRALFSPIACGFYLSAGLGLGSTEHGEPPGEGEVGRKGISCERTFAAISAKPDLESKCEELVKHLAEEMEEKGLKGKTLTLKLKDTDFKVRTRNATLAQHTFSASSMLPAALRLLHAELPIKIRLMGVRMANFLEVKTSPNQQTLTAFVRRRPHSAKDRTAVLADAHRDGSNDAGPCAPHVGEGGAVKREDSLATSVQGEGLGPGACGFHMPTERLPGKVEGQPTCVPGAAHAGIVGHPPGVHQSQVDLYPPASAMDCASDQMTVRHGGGNAAHPAHAGHASGADQSHVVLYSSASAMDNGLNQIASCSGGGDGLIQEQWRLEMGNRSEGGSGSNPGHAPGEHHNGCFGGSGSKLGSVKLGNGVGEGGAHASTLGQLLGEDSLGDGRANAPTLGHQPRENGHHLHSAQDGECMMTGLEELPDGEQGTPSQSLELSLRDWACPNQAASSGQAPSLGDWAANSQMRPPSSTAGTPTPSGLYRPARRLQHYHSGVSVTGPQTTCASPPEPESDTGASTAQPHVAFPTPTAAQPGACPPAASALWGGPHRCGSSAPADRVPGSRASGNSTHALASGESGGDTVQPSPTAQKGLSFQVGPQKVGVAEGAGATSEGALFNPYQGAEFCGWQAGFTGRGMCGKHPQACEMKLVDDSGGGEVAPAGEIAGDMHMHEGTNMGTSQQVKRKGRERWACRLCTFAENEAAWLRCQVCESVRGSSHDSLPTLALTAGLELVAEPGAGLRPHALRCRGVGERVRRPPSASASHARGASPRSAGPPEAHSGSGATPTPTIASGINPWDPAPAYLTTARNAGNNHGGPPRSDGAGGRLRGPVGPSRLRRGSSDGEQERVEGRPGAAAKRSADGGLHAGGGKRRKGSPGLGPARTLDRFLHRI